VLIDNGADVNVKNEDGWTPLQVATNRKIKGLLKSKSNKDKK